MNLDFLEIGTSDFDTLIQECAVNIVGMSIEPVKYYLDRLPDKPYVEKINCAISPTDEESDIEVFYLTEEVILKHGKPSYLKGCSNIGKIHSAITMHEMDKYVSSYTVKQYPISVFLERNNIENIDYFKIDTEGNDCDILLHYAEYLKETGYYPKKIKFESNTLTTEEKIIETINTFKKFGYSVNRQRTDTTLEK